jgi:perosamine synthetase
MSMISTQPSVRTKMLFVHRRRDDVYPFSANSLQPFFFARNGVWHAVRLLGLSGKQVLVPSYHHGVEVEALVDAGARPVFYRVDENMQVDLAGVEKKIGPETGALYLIHFLGFPGPAAAFKKLADARGLKVIEDCALALFSSDGRTPLGSTGDASVFCLYKSLPVPHGGIMALNGSGAAYVPTEPPPLYSTLSHLGASLLLANPEFGAVGRAASREDGQRVDPGGMTFEREHVCLGMSALSWRVLDGQDVDRIRSLRRKNFMTLLRELRQASPPVFDELPEGVCPLFYPLMVEDKARMMEEMKRRGIETVDFWRTGYPACADADYPEAARLRATVLELPCHQDLSEEDVMKVARETKEALARLRAPQTPVRRTLAAPEPSL